MVSQVSYELSPHGAISTAAAAVSVIRGRLIHQADSTAVATTLHPQPDTTVRLNIYATGWFYNTLLGSVKPDIDGRFDVRFDTSLLPRRWWWQKEHSLQVEVLQKTRPFAQNYGLRISTPESIVESLPARAEFQAQTADLGDLELTYARQYADMTIFQIPPKSHFPAFDYLWKLFTSLSAKLPKSFSVQLLRPFLTNLPVQKIYSIYGAVYPERPKVPKQLMHALLNEICAVAPHVVDREQNKVIWKSDFSTCAFDIPRSLPDVVEVHARLCGDELPELESILIQYRDQPPHVIQVGSTEPGQRPLDWAIYIAQSAFAAMGEASRHLAEGHLVPGLYAKPFFRHIPEENPIFKLLAPHLDQLDFINWLGSRGIIFGQGSVLEIGALTKESLQDVILGAAQKKADWSTYVPPETLASPKNHYLAHSEKECFNAFHDFFSAWLEGNWDAPNRSEKEPKLSCWDVVSQPEHWKPLYRWSQNCHSYLKAIPEFIQGEERPAPGDKEKLITVMAFIMTRVVCHYLIHSQQDILANIKNASLAPRDEAMTADGTLAADGNTTANDASRQLSVATLLLEFPADEMLVNPKHDIDPGLYAVLKQLIEQGSMRYFAKASHMHKNVQI